MGQRLHCLHDWWFLVMNVGHINQKVGRDLRLKCMHSDSLTRKWKMAPVKNIVLYKQVLFHFVRRSV